MANSTPTSNLWKYQGVEAGRSALVVLGGPSGSRWRDVQHDVLVGVNGSILTLDRMDYWVGLEIDDLRNKRWIPWNKTGQALGLGEKSPVKILHWQARRRYHVNPGTGQTDIETGGFDLSGYDWTMRSDHEPDCRESVSGLKMGPQRGNGDPQDGTAISTAVHFCGLLGCSEVHTIGADLHLNNYGDQFWYPDEPRYGISESKGSSPIWDFTGDDHKDHPYYGLVTMRWWANTAEFLVRLRKEYWRQGFKWFDHSDGLLQRTPGWDDVDG